MYVLEDRALNLSSHTALYPTVPHEFVLLSIGKFPFESLFQLASLYQASCGQK